MCSETLPAPTQPDEPPDVLAPCHTGRPAKVCAFDIALLEASDCCPHCQWDYVHAPWCPPTRKHHAVDVALLEDFGACISCGVPLGATHLPSCAFKTLGCAP